MLDESCFAFWRLRRLGLLNSFNASNLRLLKKPSRSSSVMAPSVVSSATKLFYRMPLRQKKFLQNAVKTKHFLQNVVTTKKNTECRYDKNFFTECRYDKKFFTECRYDKKFFYRMPWRHLWCPLQMRLDSKVWKRS